MYEYIAFSRARRDTALERAGVPIRSASTANPGGVGHGWVKARFVEEKTRKPRKSAFIPAKVADNPGLDVADYTESLSTSATCCARSCSTATGARSRVPPTRCSPSTSTCSTRSTSPTAWETFESFDWGSTNPTCRARWAVDYDGNLVVFDELYVEEPQPHLPDDVVPLLKARRAWWHAGRASSVTPTRQRSRPAR
jgi:hypothetical protein